MIQYGILAAVVTDTLLGGFLFLFSEEDWKDNFKVKHLLFLLLFPFGVLLGFLVSIAIKGFRNFVPLFLNFLNRPLFGKGKRVDEYYLNPKQRRRVSQNMYMVIGRLDREKDRSLMRFKGLIDGFGIFNTRFVEDINIITDWNLKMDEFFLEPRKFYDLLNSKTGS